MASLSDRIFRRTRCRLRPRDSCSRILISQSFGLLIGGEMSRNPTFVNLADRPFRIAAHPAAAAIRKSQTGYKPALAPRLMVDGVFQGGGALGTAYVGALRVLHDNAI